MIFCCLDLATCNLTALQEADSGCQVREERDLHDSTQPFYKLHLAMQVLLLSFASWRALWAVTTPKYIGIGKAT